jgi:hypothetical protein
MPAKLQNYFMALTTFPFTQQQFLNVFGQYNLAVFPLQIIFVILGIAALGLALKKSPLSDRIILLILSFFWFWMGIVYHILFFASINPLAYVFGMVFIIEAILLLYFGVIKKQVEFRLAQNRYAITGLILIVYALIIYPIIGTYLGHGYPWLPTFGLPCPTTIFTFGIFLMADKKFPLPMLVIPLFWSIIGFFAALSLGITEDYLLLVAGLAGTALIVLKNRKTAAGHPARPGIMR